MPSSTAPSAMGLWPLDLGTVPKAASSATPPPPYQQTAIGVPPWLREGGGGLPHRRPYPPPRGLRPPPELGWSQAEAPVRPLNDGPHGGPVPHAPRT